MHARTDPALTSAGRLAGKIVLVTGGAGNIGGDIVRRALGEGATVVLAGRTAAKLEAATAALEAGGRATWVAMDGGDPEAVRRGIAEVVARHGRIDVLVNNAGSAGPRAPLASVPMAGEAEGETLPDAIRNILGVTWTTTRAAAPHLAAGASVINVSTIFSRTVYYGRTAYVVPKAALNALSLELAKELGARGIRVNSVFPGPIESERIRTVFGNMDALRGDSPGTTADQFMGVMSLAPNGQSKCFPTTHDVANTIMFLASDDSAAFNGHEFAVTHGMAVAPESRSTANSRPTLRAVDGGGLGVLIVAGDQLDEAMLLARVHAECAAEVTIGLPDPAQVETANARIASAGASKRMRAVHVRRTEPATLDAVLAGWQGAPLAGALLLPAHGPGRFAGSLAEASDADVEAFFDEELQGAVAVGRSLTRWWAAHPELPRQPRFAVLTNADDGRGNCWANVLRAGMDQLVRVWRDEAAVDAAHGRRPNPEWGNQLVRYDNPESENLPFAAGLAARLLFKERRVAEVNIYLPRDIREATGARRALFGEAENLTGLHLGKVALITGGTAGIGGQVARLLAIAGARVVICARREAETEGARLRIVRDLADLGLPDVERRVVALSGYDVADIPSLGRAVDVTMEAFGRIDYLINNAGVSGAEEMVVDMGLADWRRTLDANLVSNYALMHAVLPAMKAQGSGYVLNVSSYFGGQKNLAVAYPNRADYAVSKGGQRALIETLAGLLGPEVQINAIAPGPVDGDRLGGVGGRPGLFERRGKLILENKRLNAVHAAVVKAARRGVDATDALARLAGNDTAALARDPDAPHELRELARKCHAEGTPDCQWGEYLLTPEIAAKLVARLAGGGRLDAPPGDWLARAPDPARFLPPASVSYEAEKVGAGVKKLLHLGKMPTESEVALATVYFLADRAVTGETFMPSGGLNLERSSSERELFGSPKPERIAMLAGRTAWLIGEHLTDYLAETARQLIVQGSLGKLVLVTRTLAGADAVLAQLGSLAGRVVEAVIVEGDDIEGALAEARARGGAPTTIVSTPFEPIPADLDLAALDAAGFGRLCEANLTHHFRVARIASLIDDAQLVLVSPDVATGAGEAAFALANFVKTTLHAFTATLAVENERLVHDVPVNQINLTRRVRSEEPRNAAEHAEEVRRFARAVLLAGAPLVEAEESRYRSRIYRGMAITV